MAAKPETVTKRQPGKRYLVVVNADDWGISRQVTDSILSCFAVHAISSTSAMMWMQDSARAADLALAQGLPTGLHINLDTPFAGGSVPLSARLAQAKVLPWFASRFVARWDHILSYNPSLKFQRAVDTCIQAQVDEFCRVYGAQPTHIDGHHHVHLAWNALSSRAIPVASALRSSTWQGNTPRPLRVVHSYRRRLVERRFRTTRLFLDFRHIHPELGGKWPEALDAPGSTIEVMVHPGMADELRVLRSQPWIRVAARLPLGSFDELR